MQDSSSQVQAVQPCGRSRAPRHARARRPISCRIAPALSRRFEAIHPPRCRQAKPTATTSIASADTSRCCIGMPAPNTQVRRRRAQLPNRSSCFPGPPQWRRAPAACTRASPAFPSTPAGDAGISRRGCLPSSSGMHTAYWLGAPRRPAHKPLSARLAAGTGRGADLGAWRRQPLAVRAPARRHR